MPGRVMIIGDLLLSCQGCMPNRFCFFISLQNKSLHVVIDCLFLLECYLILTYQSKIVSKNKWRSLMVWFAPSVPQRKLSKICFRQSYIYLQMHVLIINEDKRSLFGKFAFWKPISMKCRLRTKAEDYGLAAQRALIIKYLIMKHIKSDGKISMVDNS